MEHISVLSILWHTRPNRYFNGNLCDRKIIEFNYKYELLILLFSLSLPSLLYQTRPLDQMKQTEEFCIDFLIDVFCLFLFFL